MTLLRRIAPAVVLFFLAPWIAEFLLGDFPIRMLPLLLVLAPMYGGGALLIREVARRAGRGWPTMLLLGLAYGIFEEAFTTQSLFNPNYLHLNLRLLAPAHIAWLGISVWWTIFVVTLHVVWSMACSIAIVEALFAARAEQAWLRAPGLTVTAALFLLGVVVSTAITLRSDSFHATRPQFAVAALLCLLLVALALTRPIPHRWDYNLPAPVKPAAPSPWVTGGVALAAGSIFMLIPSRWSWGAVTAYLALDAIVLALVLGWARRRGWGAGQRLGLASGALLVYAWHQFLSKPVLGGGGSSVLIGKILFALLALLLIRGAARATREALRAAAPAAAIPAGASAAGSAGAGSDASRRDVIF